MSWGGVAAPEGGTLLGVLALTAEELALLAERHQTLLPPTLRPDHPPEHRALAAAVAGRSLLARGLALADSRGLRLTPTASTWLAPMLRADVSVEVALSLPGGDPSVHVIMGGLGAVVVLDQREPGVWMVSRRDVDVMTALRDVIDDGAPGGTATTWRGGQGRTTLGWSPGDDIDIIARLRDLLAAG